MHVAVLAHIVVTACLSVIHIGTSHLSDAASSVALDGDPLMLVMLVTGSLDVQQQLATLHACA
jgi:hypothetical protein